MNRANGKVVFVKSNWVFLFMPFINHHDPLFVCHFEKIIIIIKKNERRKKGFL